MKRIFRYSLIAMVTLITLLSVESSYAQHTIGLYGGWGSSNIRTYPVMESKAVYGMMNAGFSWRTYSKEPVVGCFGVDFEFIQRGFSIAPNASSLTEGEEIYYYTRKINSLMIPIVWQPHVYMFHRRVRAFLEAAAVLYIDLNSTYDNDIARQSGTTEDLSGEYEYLTARDNRVGYGLIGGGGLAILIERFEILFKVRYLFGYSDVMRNRNKYYSNSNGDVDNPFYLTPIRSPMSNLNFSFGFNYHLGEKGFKAWNHKKIKKTQKGHDFNYSGAK